MPLYDSGSALTIEIGDRFASKERFVHDFEFQTSVLFSNNRIPIPYDCTLVAIKGKFKTAPTGCDAICNVRRNNTQLFSGDDRPKIAAGSTNLLKLNISIALAAGDYLEWEDIQKGSTVAGGYGQIVMVMK